MTFDRLRGLEASRRGIDVQVRVLAPTDDDTMPVRVGFPPRAMSLPSTVNAEGTASR